MSIMTAAPSEETSNNCKGSGGSKSSSNAKDTPVDICRHTSTSSYHSENTLCNEPAGKYVQPNVDTKLIASMESAKISGSDAPPHAAAAVSPPPPHPRRISADDESGASIAQAIASSANTSSPRIDKRPSLMRRFLGSANKANSGTASIPQQQQQQQSGNQDVPTTNSSRPASPAHSTRSSTAGSQHHRGGSVVSSAFEQKYGTCSRECIGRGATAVVRVAYKQHKDGPQMYAIKRFSKQGPNETEREYIKKLTSEYCISSS
ncbi:hypothetical protein GGI23_007820, partial [Coemansia sp. RSA 2559]